MNRKSFIKSALAAIGITAAGRSMFANKKPSVKLKLWMEGQTVASNAGGGYSILAQDESGFIWRRDGKSKETLSNWYKTKYTSRDAFDSFEGQIILI